MRFFIGRPFLSSISTRANDSGSLHSLCHWISYPLVLAGYNTTGPPLNDYLTKSWRPLTLTLKLDYNPIQWYFAVQWTIRCDLSSFIAIHVIGDRWNSWSIIAIICYLIDGGKINATISLVLVTSNIHRFHSFKYSVRRMSNDSNGDLMVHVPCFVRGLQYQLHWSIERYEFLIATVRQLQLIALKISEVSAGSDVSHFFSSMVLPSLLPPLLPLPTSPSYLYSFFLQHSFFYGAQHNVSVCLRVFPACQFVRMYWSQSPGGEGGSGQSQRPRALLRPSGDSLR